MDFAIQDKVPHLSLFNFMLFSLFASSIVHYFAFVCLVVIKVAFFGHG